MCGIVVQFNFNKNKHANDSVMADMLAAIKHRGTDQVVIDNYNNFNVGFRRLAITDVKTNQPGRSTNWIVYLNGEIYNYKELGYTGTECEVLAKGFEEHGVDFVQKLNGMFAIVAINNGVVWVCRDRYGIKPMYYWITDNKIIMASEIKAIIQHKDYTFKVNDSAKEQWMTFNNILTDDTLFLDIQKMDKGSYMCLNIKTITKYWHWEFKPTPMDYDVAVKKVRSLVVAAIKKQIPNLPFGTCLSSGIDSNIINHVIGDQYTFTAGFNHTLDESHLARKHGKKHYEVIYNKVRNLNETIYHLEDLRVGASWANYGVCELASKFVKVLFDGAGADELFGGYTWRYKTLNYYFSVNRTGYHNDHMVQLFKNKFPVDTLETRYEFDANYFLEGVLLVGDKLSMAHTIEMRVPFLDNDLVDFCLTLPNEFKENKRILKDAFVDLLPGEILNATKKGFSSPDWFEGDGNQAQKWATTAFNKWNEIFKP